MPFDQTRISHDTFIYCFLHYCYTTKIKWDIPGFNNPDIGIQSSVWNGNFRSSLSSQTKKQKDNMRNIAFQKNIFKLGLTTEA